MVIPNSSLTVSVDSTSTPGDYTCTPLFCEILIILGRINPSLLPLRPWNFNTKEFKPIFEIQAFGDIVLEPHTELINLLYVYPLSLK